MNHPFQLSITDWSLAEQARDQVELGHFFVFVKDGKVLRQAGRMGRLFGYKAAAGRSVLPLVETPVELAGFTVTPGARPIAPLACLISDRDLYRAEQDTVRLFAAVPSPPKQARLKVAQNGAPLFEKTVEIGAGGVMLESLSMLVAGRYEVELYGDGGSLGAKVSFTVAEYTLAPLSARLIGHQLLRLEKQLRFDLSISSYQVPYDRSIVVSLLDGARKVDQTTLKCAQPGRYAGQLGLSGEGPFRLQLASTEDAARVAEVVIPGSRKSEIELTRISELGREFELSLMPEPNAIPVRGLFVSEGDHLATPVTVEEVIVEEGRLKAETDLEALTLVIADLAHNKFEVRSCGNVSAGSHVPVPLPGPMCTVFVGCFVDGYPFEGFTSFLKRPKLDVRIELPSSVRPKEELEIRVACRGIEGKVPCLISVRDERLTQLDTPQVALAAAAKKSLQGLTKLLDDGVSFVPIERALRATPRDAAPLGPGNMLFLVTDAGDMFKVEKETFIIGRSETCDLSIPSTRVSRQHAGIVREGGVDYIEDLGSANGVWKNHRKITREVLRDGDEITIGDAVIKAIYRGGPGEARDDRDGGPLRNGGDPFEELTPVASHEGGGAEVWLRGAPDFRGHLDLEEDLAFAEEDLPRNAVSALRTGAPSIARQQRPVIMEDQYDDDSVSGLPPPGDPPSEPPRRPEPPEPIAPEPRASFPEVVFFGVIAVEGEATIEIPLGDALTTYAVEVFAFTGTEWSEQKATVEVDQPARIDLDLPPAVHPEDRVIGHLRAACTSGQTRVRVTLDGTPVELKKSDGTVVGPTEILSSPAELTLSVRPGTYLATVEDCGTKERDQVEVLVSAPGRFKSYVRELALLQRGGSLTLDSENAIALRVLPALDQPFRTLTEATAGYGHSCCEQTGAKILAAVVMYLSSTNPKKRALAEDIIVAGIAREEQMWRRGRGFAAYPEYSDVVEYYTPTVVRYLWSLDQVSELRDLSSSLRASVRLGLEMAEDVARACRLSRIPTRITSMEDAYAVAAARPDRKKEVLAYVEQHVDLNAGTLKIATAAAGKGVAASARAAFVRIVGSNGQAIDPVAQRQRLAYAAAALLAVGELASGIRVANTVTRQLNNAGRLYSTYDSIAAIALMTQLQKHDIAGGGGKVRIDGRTMDTKEATALKDEIESVEVLDGVAVVEVTRIHEEDWSSFSNELQVGIGFRDHNGRKATRFRQGDRAELIVQLPKGYKMGDLVHVSLPACMSWIHGGGRVKKFSIDFEGKDELRVPLVVTSPIIGREHFAVCVRNMFEETRATSPGLIAVNA